MAFASAQGGIRCSRQLSWLKSKVSADDTARLLASAEPFHTQVDHRPVNRLRKNSLLRKCQGRRAVVSHISRKTSETPNFLHAALERTACAPFIKERRMKFREPTKLHRKSGVWGTRSPVWGDVKSPGAAAESELERRFREFEAKFWGLRFKCETTSWVRNPPAACKPSQFSPPACWPARI